MMSYQHSTGPDTDQHGAGAGAAGPAARQPGEVRSLRHANGHSARRNDCQGMIAVTPEHVAPASGSAGTSGYLPTVPADSEEPSLD
jgi:hypothetical protein